MALAGYIVPIALLPPVTFARSTAEAMPVMAAADTAVPVQEKIFTRV